LSTVFTSGWTEKFDNIYTLKSSANYLMDAKGSLANVISLIYIKEGYQDLLDMEENMAEIKSLKRNIFQRLFGICATRPPANRDCWQYGDGSITIDLNRTPELALPGGAIRLESDDLPERILVTHGDDNRYYAFQNKCQHAGRRLDPVPETETVQCCSVGKATYDYSGKLIHGSAKGDIKIYDVQEDSGTIVIRVE